MAKTSTSKKLHTSLLANMQRAPMAPTAAAAAAALLLIVGTASAASASSSCPNVTITSQPSWSVMNSSTPGASGGANKYGFEDGRVVRSATTGHFHLAVAEMVGDPKWVGMSLGHWMSEDGWTWTRSGTLRNCSGRTDGSDPCAAVWGPSFLFDPSANRYALAYVCYNSAPSNSSGWYGNFNGSIFVAYADAEGDAGLDGVGEGGFTTNQTNVLYPLPGGYRPWQGLQGTDSFFPYPLPNGTWAGLYGSAHTESSPVAGWVIGFATSPSLLGPWSRFPEDDPELVYMTTNTTENPMVFPLPAGMGAPPGAVMAVFDYIGQEGTGFGIACSQDGVTWPRGALVPTPGGARTPFSLLPMTPADVRANRAALLEGGVSAAVVAAWEEEVEVEVGGSAPYWLFYSQQVGGYEVVRTALVTLSW
jgi:hypothetical protein